MGTTPRSKSVAFVVDVNLLNDEKADKITESLSAYDPGDLQARFIAYRAEKQQQLLNLRRADDLSSTHISSSHTNTVNLSTKLSRASPFKTNSTRLSSANSSISQKSIALNTQSESISKSSTSTTQNDNSAKISISSSDVSVDCLAPSANSVSVKSRSQETLSHQTDESPRTILLSQSKSALSISQEPAKTEISPVSVSPVTTDSSVSSTAPVLTIYQCVSFPSASVVSLESQIKSLSLASAERCTLLRRAFVERAMSYRGVPYARKYWAPHEPEFYSPLFLDCCGLVRRALRDLSPLFHFVIGPWNQAYMFDTLRTPETASSEEVKPDEQKIPDWVKEGDLVFLEGVYHNPKARQQYHYITHVEILLADGEKTLGSRWWRGKVQVFDTFRFAPSTYRLVRFHFLSIERWLRGECCSHCPTHQWRVQKRKQQAADERRRADCALNPRSLFYVPPEKEKSSDDTEGNSTAENSNAKDESCVDAETADADVAADEANQCEEIVETDSELSMCSPKNGT